jgi:outer membrane protein
MAMSRLQTLLAVVIALLLPPQPSDAQSEKGGVAVVDLQGAVMQTEEGIKAQAQLKKLLDKRQVDLDAKQTSLARMRADIERQARFLSREALTKRMEVWQKEMLSLQGSFVDYNKELEKRQSELTAPIIQRMIALVTKIARQNGYDLVLDKRAAPYARPDLDLTERVVQMYNAGESG